MDLLQKYDNVKTRYEQIQQELSDPQTLANTQKLAELSREHSRLSKLVSCFEDYRKTRHELEENTDPN